MIEKWRPVPGYKGFYEVSNRGRIRGLKRGKMLRPAFRKRSGPAVVLSKNAVKHNKYVGALVLLAFVGPRPKGMQTRHFPDPNITNNNLFNLSWATPLVNQRDRDIHGTHNKGESNSNSKLTDKAVREIRRVKSWPYGSLTRMAEKFDVTRSCISYVRDRKNWRHI
jgi:hypothetical protein